MNINRKKYQAITKCSQKFFDELDKLFTNDIEIAHRLTNKKALYLKCHINARKLSKKIKDSKVVFGWNLVYSGECVENGILWLQQHAVVRTKTGMLVDDSPGDKTENLDYRFFIEDRSLRTILCNEKYRGDKKLDQETLEIEYGWGSNLIFVDSSLAQHKNTIAVDVFTNEDYVVI